MNIIIPIQFTAAMIGTGSPAEPTSVGTVWAAGNYPTTGTIRVRPTTNRRYEVTSAHDSSGGAYPPPERDPAHWADLGPTSAPVEVVWDPYVAVTTGDQVIRTGTHLRYRATKDMVAADNTMAPELDETVWQPLGSTNRWSPFDLYTTSQAHGVTSITYVLSPGYFNAVALYGLIGSQYSVVVKDAPGGTVLYERDGFLTQDPLGWYEYLFTPPVPITKLVFTNIPLSPSAELTLTITAATDAPVAIGSIVVGDLVSLAGDPAKFGSAQHGATAEPITYSYIDDDGYGKMTIVRRHSATNMRCRIVLPRADADAVLQRLQSVLDVPVACIATTSKGYDGLNVFGLISTAPVSYDDYYTASIEVNVKGFT